MKKVLLAVLLILSVVATNAKEGDSKTKKTNDVARYKNGKWAI